MDIKVKNKDICININGQPETVEGIDEYLQKAYISFTAIRGNFCYQRDLGAYKNLKEILNEAELIKEAEAALCDFPELNILKVERDGESLIFTVSTPLGEGEVRL